MCSSGQPRWWAGSESTGWQPSCLSPAKSPATRHVQLGSGDALSQSPLPGSTGQGLLKQRPMWCLPSPQSRPASPARCPHADTSGHDHKTAPQGQLAPHHQKRRECWLISEAHPPPSG